jgi:tetratricopeptide (TPR) repeat protein
LILAWIDFNFVGAETGYERAVKVAPQDPETVLSLANQKAFPGRLDEAVALDPLRNQSHYDLAFTLIALGRYDETEAALHKAIELQPKAAQNDCYLAIAQILRGKPATAVALAKQGTDPFFRTWALALAYYAHGDRAEADAALKKLIDEDADDGGSQIASVYALRKEPDKVFEWLEHGWVTRDGGVTEMLSDPFLLAYKNDRRFIAFAQKIAVMSKGVAKP